MPRDVFHFINDLDEATVERIAARLEFRATDPGFVAMREAQFEKLPLTSAHRVLALGCGTGVEVRALKRHPEFQGEIVGVDHSPKLLDEARRRTAAEGLADGVEFRVGNACELALPDAGFDIVLAHTLLSHVSQPLNVLQEALRVVRPGGIVAIFDGDYASLTFAYSEPGLARRVEDALLEVLANSPRVMRDLPRLLRQAGLQLVGATAHVYADVGVAGLFANMVETYGALLTEAAGLSGVEIDAWRTEQTRDIADGTFFGACSYYTYLARRPATTEAV